MGVLIVASDFKGKFAIPQTTYSIGIDQFINDYEEYYLIDMLGADFYADFKSNLDVNKVPQAQKYKDIYNSFSKDYGIKKYKSKGMKEMLLGFIFFDYMREIGFKATSAGMVTTSPDTSQKVNYGSLYKYLNDATDSCNSIQTYILLINPSNYLGSGLPVFNGAWRRYSIPTFE